MTSVNWNELEKVHLVLNAFTLPSQLLFALYFVVCTPSLTHGMDQSPLLTQNKIEDVRTKEYAVQLYQGQCGLGVESFCQFVSFARADPRTVQQSPFERYLQV